MRGVSKDGREFLANPSRLAAKCGEHLWMTVVKIAEDAESSNVPVVQ